jgi:lambda family phage portal protein
MSFIDDVVGVFSPRAKLQRLQYKQALSSVEKRKYEGASKAPRMSGWQTQSTSADAETEGQLEILRNRSRDLVRNNPYAERAVSVIANNVVGRGIMASITAPSKTKEKKLREAWQRWTTDRKFSVNCQMDLVTMQHHCMRATAESGEVLLRRIRSADTGFTTKVQVLESDHLATELVYQSEATGNRIVQGIELDANDCPVAYHIYKTHPSNGGIDLFNSKAMEQSTIRVPAEDIRHLKRTDRPSQNRGVPWLAACMVRLQELDQFEDAMLLKQKVSACFSAFVRDIEIPADIQGTNGNPALPEKLQPATIEYLPMGKDITFANPPMPPTGSYEGFVDHQLHAIAAGLGISFEALTGNLSQVNFSSARMGWLEFQRSIDSWRHEIMVGQMLSGIWEWFAEDMEINGVKMSDVVVSWTPPRREMIDPTKEIPAMMKSVRSGFSTISDVLRQTGKHPDTHFAEYKKDMETLDELEMILDTDPRHTNTAGTIQMETSPDDSVEQNSNGENANA